MASAHKYQWVRADGIRKTRYRARWTGPDGKPRFRRGFDRKSDAEAFAADREAEVRHGVVLSAQQPTGRTTVEQWARTWQQGLQVRPSTADAYHYALQRITRDLGTRTLVSLRPSELKAWRKNLEQRYAPTTASLTNSVLAMLLRAAVEDGLLAKSPLPPAKGSAAAKVRVVDPAQLLTMPQVLAWSAALPDRLKAAPIVAATTGLRQGELLGLQAADIDFLGRVIRVSRQLLTRQGAVYGPTKTPAGVRTVPLPALAAEALAAHLAAFPAVEGEPVFRGFRGQRWMRGNFHTQVVQAKRRAGLPEWAHWHALRDVCASSHIRAGTDLRTLMTLLGHTSSEETLRTYARLWPDAVDNARKGVDALWAADSESHGRATNLIGG